MKKNKSNLGCFGWGSIIALCIVLILYIFSISGPDIDPNAAQSKLHPEIHWTNTKLIITNNDVFDYHNTNIRLNDDYSYNVDMTLEAHQTYTIGLMQFANNDGLRFNPFQMKIKNISISNDEGFAYLENVH